MRRRGPAPPPRRPPFARRSCTGSFSPTHAQPQCFAAARATRLVLASVCVGLPEPYLQHALRTAAKSAPREAPNTTPGTRHRCARAPRTRPAASGRPPTAPSPWPPSARRARPAACLPRPALGLPPTCLRRLPVCHRRRLRLRRGRPDRGCYRREGLRLPWAGRARASVACPRSNDSSPTASVSAGGGLTGVTTAARASFSPLGGSGRRRRRGGPRRGPRNPIGAWESVNGSR